MLSQSIQIIKALLINTSLTGFSFDSFFTLRFSRGTEYFNGVKLPHEIELNLGSNWWFGIKDEWLSQVEYFTSKNKHKPVEPDEPVKAFELTCLRWSERNIVEAVDIRDRSMSITFENGIVINILNEVEMDDSWVISECKYDLSSRTLAVCDRDGEIFTYLLN